MRLLVTLVVLMPVSLFALGWWYATETKKERELLSQFECRTITLLQAVECSEYSEKLYIRRSSDVSRAACWNVQTGAFRPVAICQDGTHWQIFDDPVIETHTSTLSAKWREASSPQTNEVR